MNGRGGRKKDRRGGRRRVARGSIQAEVETSGSSKRGEKRSRKEDHKWQEGGTGLREGWFDSKVETARAGIKGEAF